MIQIAEYHVGCGIFRIYAGILKPNGTEWKDKTDVTEEAISAVAEYLLMNHKEFHFEVEDKMMILKVEEEE